MTDNSAHGYSEGSECVDCAKEKRELRQEIQQLKEALRKYNEATDYSKTYQMWSPTKELDKAYNNARKLIEPNKPEK